MKVISRLRAEKLGLDTYFLKPCVHGHTDGRSVTTGRCLACDRKRSQERQQIARNAENKRAKEALRYRKAREKCWASYILQQVKKRARKKGLEFNLEVSDIPQPSHCPILGTRLDYVGGNKYDREHSPSVDRIDNTLGYVKGNVQVISYRANRFKNNSTTEELHALVKHARRIAPDDTGFRDFFGD